MDYERYINHMLIKYNIPFKVHFGYINNDESRLHFLERINPYIIQIELYTWNTHKHKKPIADISININIHDTNMGNRINFYMYHELINQNNNEWKEKLYHIVCAEMKKQYKKDKNLNTYLYIWDYVYHKHFFYIYKYASGL